jgi:ankyrin repeat protein
MGLHQAIMEDDEEGVRTLLLSSPNIPDSHGDSGFLVACANNRPKIVRLMLGFPEVDVWARNKAGRTPLYCAAFWSAMGSLLELFASPRIALSAREEEGGDRGALAEIAKLRGGEVQRWVQGLLADPVGTMAKASFLLRMGGLRSSHKRPLPRCAREL